MSKRKPVPAAAERTPAEVEATESAVEEAKAEDTSSDEPKDDDNAKSEEPKDEEPKADESLEARVLVAFDDHEVNSVISGSEEEIDQLVREGRVDPHPAAVEFAKSL